MAASYEDAAIGWVIYRDRKGDVGREQLNAALSDLGRSGIAKRTYEHYQKMLKLGYKDYVSINRLDLRHASDSIFDTADRARYPAGVAAGSATLVVPASTGVAVLGGDLVSLSEGYATLRVPNTAEASTVARAKKFNRGVLVLDEVGVERAVQVLEGVEIDGALDLVLEFRSLLETELARPTSTLTSDYSLSFSLGPAPSLFLVVEAMHRTFDLYESARVFSNMLLELSAAEGLAVDAEAAPVAKVRRVALSNPIEIVIAATPIVFGTIVYVLKHLPGWLADVANAASSLQSVGLAKNEERRTEELHKLEAQSMQLGNIKSAVEIAGLIESAGPGVSELLPMLPGMTPEQVRRLTALKDQTVEAAAELSMMSKEPLAISEAEPDETVQ